jgi:phosphohistidine swiveling domain-containing protein
MPARSVISFCVPLQPGAPPERVGGKARSLLRLREAGLPVPPAFVVTSEVFQALRQGGPPLPAELGAPGALAAIARAAEALRSAVWPDGFLEELAAALAALPGDRLSVRSSADTEDEAGALAAGLFSSRVGVARSEIERALREVLATALAPGVIAYLGAAGRSTAGLSLAALVHPYVEGAAAGTAAGDGAGVLVEAPHGAPSAEVRRHLEAAIATLASHHGPVEVEWVAAGEAPVFLQMRPYRPGARRQSASAGDDWRWDAAHNPLPLSPAQAGLVALVDARCRVPFEQRVVDGYLFYRPRTSGPAASGAPSAKGSPRPLFQRLEQAADQRLARPQPLDDALETFAAIYEPLFGEVQPATRAARASLSAFLAEAGADAATIVPGLLASVPSAAAARASAADRIARAADETEREEARAAYAALFGDESPVWDVAEPTWRERPRSIPSRPSPTAAPKDNAEIAARIRDGLADVDRPRWDQVLEAAREGAAVAEDDDALYARAQAHVRRALLVEGERLTSAGVLAQAEDVFWLPLELVRRFARGEVLLSPEEARRSIAAARADHERAGATAPSLEAATGGAAGVIRGRPGSPGARIGRVQRWPALRADVEAPVVVARTILPTELPLIAAAALVVETGGVLDHVAAQARERGIPAVVGAAGALDALSEGDRVLVDGDAGLVAKLG